MDFAKAAAALEVSCSIQHQLTLPSLVSCKLSIASAADSTRQARRCDSGEVLPQSSGPSKDGFFLLSLADGLYPPTLLVLRSTKSVSGEPRRKWVDPRTSRRQSEEGGRGAGRLAGSVRRVTSEYDRRSGSRCNDGTEAVHVSEVCGREGEMAWKSESHVKPAAE